MASGLNGARNGSVATIKKSARCQSKCTCRARGASAAALKPRLIAAAARAIKPKVYFIFFIFYIAEITLPDLLFSHLRCTRVCLSPPFAYSCVFWGGFSFLPQSRRFRSHSLFLSAISRRLRSFHRTFPLFAQSFLPN